jgi:hypothetical protein
MMLFKLAIATSAARAVPQGYRISLKTGLHDGITPFDKLRVRTFSAA